MSEHPSNITPTGTPPSVALLHMMTGHWVAQTVYVTAKLGIADALAVGPRNVEEIARCVGADAPSLRRLLRALIGAGVVVGVDNNRFDLTPVGRMLQSGAVGSVRNRVIKMGEKNYHAWGSLLHSVTTGEAAFDHLFGASIFQQHAQAPEEERSFYEEMDDSMPLVRAAIAAYDFTGARRIVDVGGGHGALIAAVLNSYPEANGVLFDLPHAVAGGRACLEAAGLADRCEIVAGDFFESVPDAGDVYLLSRIIHDWTDERSIAILGNCRKAMAEGGKLLLVEFVMPSARQSFFSTLLDLNMLVMTRGRERTEGEYRALLALVDLRVARVIPTHSPLRLIEVVSSQRN